MPKTRVRIELQCSRMFLTVLGSLRKMFFVRVRSFCSYQGTPLACRA
jgi:hypothetical protein